MHADLLWSKTSVFFAIHFTAYWRSRGVLQSQSWCNIVKILILTFLGPELHTLVIVCLVMLNTSFITIWNRTQNPEDLLISIKAIAQQKSFSTCCHPTLLLGQHSALWNVFCSGYYSSTRLLPFCARTAQHSDIKSPSLRLLAVREKPLGDHFIWRTTLVLHYILGLHVSTFYLCSLPHQLLGLVHGLDILHCDMEDFCLILDFRCLLFSGLALQSGSYVCQRQSIVVKSHIAQCT